MKNSSIFVLQNSKFSQISKSPNDIHTTLVLKLHNIGQTKFNMGWPIWIICWGCEILVKKFYFCMSRPIWMIDWGCENIFVLKFSYSMSGPIWMICWICENLVKITLMYSVVTIYFSNFSCRFLNPNNFFQFEIQFF